MNDMSRIQSQIVELRRTELTHAAIGERLGISVDVVDYQVKVLRKAGVDLPTRSNGSLGDWTAERIAKLKQLWREGKSAGIISRLLGGGVTRNAVIGKLTRLGLTGGARPRPSVSVKRVRRRRSPSPPTIARDPVSAAPEPPVAFVEPAQTAPQADGRVTIDDLRFPISQCRWIDGEPNGAATLYCGARTIIGKSYCPEHYARLWAPYRRSAA